MKYLSGPTLPTLPTLWNPVKELKANEIVWMATVPECIVESGEGIESYSLNCCRSILGHLCGIR